MVSLPPWPRIVSLPPRPAMTSRRGVPTRRLGPLVPRMVILAPAQAPAPTSGEPSAPPGAATIAASTKAATSPARTTFPAVTAGQRRTNGREVGVGRAKCLATPEGMRPGRPRLFASAMTFDTLTLPVLPLSTGVVLPSMVVTIALETDEARAAADAAEAADGRLLLVPRIDGRYAAAGTVVQIEDSGQLLNGLQALVVRGLQRATIGAGVPGTG